jgi:hypothetical protein
MATLRNRKFLQGVLLGSAAGLILGTVVAFQIVDKGADAAHKLLITIRGPKEPNRRYIVQ